MRDIDDLRRDLSDAEEERMSIIAMSEEEAINHYLVNNKAEIIAMIDEIIADLERDIEEAQAQTGASGNSPDPAFSSWGDYFRYIYL